MSSTPNWVGFRPPDDKWKRMKAVWDACEAADLSIPNEVLLFFNEEAPDPAGVEIDIGEWVTAYEGDGKTGWDVDLTSIPSDIKMIRFFESW